MRCSLTHEDDQNLKINYAQKLMNSLYKFGKHITQNNRRSQYNSVIYASSFNSEKGSNEAAIDTDGRYRN
jgi:hypothetical protein